MDNNLFNCAIGKIICLLLDDASEEMLDTCMVRAKNELGKLSDAMEKVGLTAEELLEVKMADCLPYQSVGDFTPRQLAKDIALFLTKISEQ